MDQRTRTNYRMKIEDEQIDNHTFAEEDAIWQMIREGKVESVKKIRQLSQSAYPLVIEHDVKKNEEYMVVSSIATLARVAISVGITSAESFLLSDLMLRELSFAKTVNEVHDVMVEAYVAYAELVRDHLETRSMNNYVEDCKKDIIKNIFKAISLSDIAKDLGIQPAYLSRLFSEHEGQTVTAFIHEQKISVAKNMLMYSDRSIAEIADYLKFNSQSYFGKLFKKYTGITPKVYRDTHHLPEF